MPGDERSVEELFEAALAQAPNARTAFLDEACVGSPELRRRVEDLLRADQEAGSFLNTPPVRMAFDGLDETVTATPLGRRSTVSSPTGETAPLKPGATVAGRFTINRFIARGGMGEVYEAWDADLQERVAIKTIRPELAASEEILERFRREVKQARTISHPNVCRVHELFCHEIGSDQRIWFLSMEFLEGFTLSDFLRHEGPLAPARALPLVEQIVHGLNAAHHLGVIHRDFKTGNIMLVSAGPGRLRAVITDYGLALNVLQPDGGLHEPGGQGTPAFMAPEQKQTGKVTALADQYALGIVICEMVTGARPKPATTDRPEPQPLTLPDRPLPSRWKRAILRCVQTKPERRFRNLDELLAALKAPNRSWQKWALPVAAAVLAAILVLWWQLKPAAQTTSLAVLPLQNETGDPGLEYLASGISEALTDDLSRMPGIQVTAGMIARRYGGSNVDPRTVGHTLRVGSVVSGALGASRATLRVPVELVDVKTGRQEWGKTYETTSNHIADLQHEISADVAYSLKIHLNPDTKARLKRQYSTNPLTYDAYLKGRYYLSQRSPEALQQAITMFQSALDHDPQYAPAFAGLADCYSLLGYYGLQDPIPSFQKAKDAAQQALELDSTLGEAYTSRAVTRTFLNFDWKGAEADYQRGFALNPNYLTAHTWYALGVLVPQGRQAEAAAQMAFTEAADPDSMLTAVSHATVSYFGGDFDKSIALVEPRVPQFSHFEPALQILAEAYLAKNMDDKVIRLLESDSAADDVKRERAIPLGIAYARTGQKAKALAQLSLADSSVHQGHFLSYETASLYVALNEQQRALDMLELAYARRESNLIFLNVDPSLASLRNQPRFLKLLNEMNLK